MTAEHLEFDSAARLGIDSDTALPGMHARPVPMSEATGYRTGTFLQAQTSIRVSLTAQPASPR